LQQNAAKFNLTLYLTNAHKNTNPHNFMPTYMQQAPQQEIPSFVQLVPVERKTMSEQQQHELI